MPYGQDPLQQLALEDFSRSAYEDKKRGKKKKIISGTNLANEYMKQMSEYKEKEKKFDQGYKQATALEGQLNIVPGLRKLNLDIGRSLEGLKSETPKKERYAASAERRNREGGLSDTMEQYGDSFYLPKKNERTQEQMNAMITMAKEDPETMANMASLSLIAPFTNIASDAVGAKENIAYNWIRNNLADKGDTVASKSLFKNTSNWEDYVDAGLTFSPGTFLKAGKAGLKMTDLIKDFTRITANAAKKYPKTAVAASTLGAATAYEAGKPQESDAASLSRFISLLENEGEAAARKYARQQAKFITRRHRERVWEREFGDSTRPTGAGWHKPWENLGMSDKVGTGQVYDSFMSWYKAYKRGEPEAVRLADLPQENVDALHWGHTTKPLEEGGLASEGRFISGIENLRAGKKTMSQRIAAYRAENGGTYAQAAAALGYARRK